jgi:hypothetical protein
MNRNVSGVQNRLKQLQNIGYCNSHLKNIFTFFEPFVLVWLQGVQIVLFNVTPPQISQLVLDKGTKNAEFDAFRIG